ncbi:hypothetical protein TFUB20_02535 [Tannerella forsythia]|uniref:Uncharacterized protein n=1 Tax=Tannerella forsythia TaxID=28112 RepID=A0A1D3UW73_TANFO|nr:hypothetical protein TF3313_2699 [Tannerella forsythia 3313]SCQ24534.1 hypothetical protein TFUB20_02535 [Tannerella forsythia]
MFNNSFYQSSPQSIQNNRIFSKKEEVHLDYKKSYNFVEIINP